VVLWGSQGKGGLIQDGRLRETFASHNYTGQGQARRFVEDEPVAGDTSARAKKG